MLTKRYSGIYLAVAALAGTSTLALTGHISAAWSLFPATLLALGLHDITQKKHSILRAYPILGHMRYLLESVRPELQQYLVQSDLAEVPFSRAQRSVVYQRAKGDPDAQAFGTELDVKRAGHEWIAHSLQPSVIPSADFRVVVGAGRAKPYSLSVFNISAMSFGALSANAIRALNLGAKLGGFAHDTGEGSLSKYHQENGGDIIYQIASGYFGCRTADGQFDPQRFAELSASEQVKMIEIKLSQGAKPGHGGVLPAAKVTQEISDTRGVPMGQDCISPAAHSAFKNPKEFLLFAEQLRTLSGGKPVGAKLCIGRPEEWMSIVKAMVETGITLDFVVVDGSEGGTGAAPLEFADHVGMPMQEGLVLVHNSLVGAGLRDKIRVVAAGKIVTAFDMARTLALGADAINSARSYMMAIGCIQAMSCSNSKCPTGVATQDPERQKALVVPDKAERVRNYHDRTLRALQELLQAAGLHHPSDLRPHHIVRRLSSYQVEQLSDLIEYIKPGSLLGEADCSPKYARWWMAASSESFAGVGSAGANSSSPAEKRVIWCAVDKAA
ncbi:FMN-binding glutamate synthase family protein [Burkholderia cenocepacia]|uniref:FMN-binding glutamate synthase family protein n=1 Tax=Burkholderia cenocepacia TaxID=95486 RepID=UPI0007612F85|nr:FMN-binding glutamate synthase family protein [Burkholderia cenocepacia]KWU19262.1 glutamate synthase [Burkholderia cenocepacia]